MRLKLLDTRQHYKQQRRMRMTHRALGSNDSRTLQKMAKVQAIVIKLIQLYSIHFNCVLDNHFKSKYSLVVYQCSIKKSKRIDRRIKGQILPMSVVGAHIQELRWSSLNDVMGLLNRWLAWAQGGF